MAVVAAAAEVLLAAAVAAEVLFVADVGSAAVDSRSNPREGERAGITMRFHLRVVLIPQSIPRNVHKQYTGSVRVI